MERPRGLVLVDIAVWSGRFLGILVVGIAIAVGIKVALDARDDEFWSFLATIMTPMGIGFLIVVASEIVNRIGRSQE